jgi:hypothetical protein
MFALGIVSAAAGGPLFVLSLPPWSGDSDGLWGRIAVGILALILTLVLIPMSIDKKESQP